MSRKSLSIAMFPAYNSWSSQIFSSHKSVKPNCPTSTLHALGMFEGLKQCVVDVEFGRACVELTRESAKI